MNIVEATIVLPLTILISITLILFMMNSYNDLIYQTEMHQEEIIEIYE